MTDNRETQVAWAAGFLDGEGAFCLSKTYTRGQRDHLRQPRVVASQTNKKPILELQRLFGGKVYESPNRRTKKGSQIWVWEEGGKALIPILEELVPHLVLKTEEAQEVLNYARLVGGPGQRISPEELAERNVVIADFDQARLRQ